MSGSIDEDEESDANDESTAEASQTSTLVKFDRDLRARHRAACKNMTVRRLVCGVGIALLINPAHLPHFFSNVERKIRQGDQDV